MHLIRLFIYFFFKIYFCQILLKLFKFSIHTQHPKNYVNDVWSLCKSVDCPFSQEEKEEKKQCFVDVCYAQYRWFFTKKNFVCTCIGVLKCHEVMSRWAEYMHHNANFMPINGSFTLLIKKIQTEFVEMNEAKFFLRFVICLSVIEFF